MSTNSKPLPRLGLGCGVFSGAYGPITQKEVTDTVRTALENQITLVDTSPYYGDSEIKLGNALLDLKSEFPRSSYQICTKLGRYGYHKADFDYTAARVVTSVNTSMRRLHTNYLDIVLCHDVEFVDFKQVVDETLPQLFELKQQGLVCKVGISGYPLNVLLDIAETQQKRGKPLDVCLTYCNFNLHCQVLADYTAKLHEAGVKTIIAASPLSMGLLSDSETPAWHPAKSELKAAIADCANLIDKFQSDSISLTRMAENYAFSYNKADVHLVGAKNSNEVYCALDAFSRAQRLGLAEGGKYPDAGIQRLFEQIQSILKPFASYTWPSPPEDA
ncbi:hypothetical protein LPJ78_005652 [Coemansia sp. RSA 989]|nr:NADP-dependent oxidoreductase domain-containing protein [Coemansia mojavensis]KAJ1746837.1 hypothetical protein LPJ79_005655 [Coemansia sp. RSA 1821]KAJ1860870.1 hypothetical protein LPJ78_005652 [Coemansia sp. RSA 989]KAJ1868986.1 hypothetical protein LPJ55_005665 [Coemansia sp. RSA 990]